MEKSKSILIAEDTNIQGKKLKFYLESFGYNVIWVKNAKEGIDVITSSKYTFEMIISDIQMDGGDGFELLKFVRSDPFYMSVPFILMTTLKEAEVKLQAYEMKVSEFIQKPFEPLELELRVKNLLSLSRFQKDILEQNYRLNQSLIKKSQILEKKLNDIERMYSDLQNTQSKLVDAEKHSALAVVGGGIAHEFNTPLSVISMCSSQIEMFLGKIGVDDPKVNRLNEKILNATEKISQLVSHIRNYAHPTEVLRDKQSISLKALVDEAILELNLETKEVKINVNIHEDASVNTNAVGVVKVLSNILENSLFANGKMNKNEITIYTEMSDESLALFIQDFGGGIPEDKLFNVTVPFYTLNGVGEGKGLGLAVASNFCKALDIQLSLKNSKGGLLVSLMWSNDNE